MANPKMYDSIIKKLERDAKAVLDIERLAVSGYDAATGTPTSRADAVLARISMINSRKLKDSVIARQLADIRYSSSVERLRAIEDRASQQRWEIRQDRRAIMARQRTEKRNAELKWLRVTIGIDPELLKELRWIARRDGVTFTSLVVEGLYLAKRASYIDPEILAELRPKDPTPPEGSIQ
jgi:hypothetical protein